jgi:hypothetical protein
MSATSSAYAEDGFRVGQVLSRSFGVFGRHFVLFCLVSAISVVPYLFVDGGRGGTVDPHRLAGFGWLILAASLLMPITQAIVLYGAFQDMRAKRFGLGESLAKGLARFFPIIGLGICETVVFGLGALLLVFPVFIFMAMFFVALPACVVEKAGPIASMKRSAALTKGHRWKVFGVALLLLLVNLIGASAISAVLATVGGALAVTIGALIWRTLVTAFHSTVVAVMYHDLRVAREGIDIEGMAAVFD